MANYDDSSEQKFTVYSEREWLFDFLKQAGPELWHSVAESWNWGNGTWLLDWIIRQKRCQAATAQLIFWTSVPEGFLPLSGYDEWNMKVKVYEAEFKLAKLIVENWNSGFYERQHFGLLERIKGVFGRIEDHFEGNKGNIFRLKQAGKRYRNLMLELQMKAYREQEATCDPAMLPWHIPNDLGKPIVARVPKWGSYDVHEGFPNEYLTRLLALNAAGHRS